MVASCTAPYATKNDATFGLGIVKVGIVRDGVSTSMLHTIVVGCIRLRWHSCAQLHTRNLLDLSEMNVFFADDLIEIWATETGGVLIAGSGIYETEQIGLFDV